MKLFVIYDGATLKGWSLREGSYRLGQGPSVDLRLSHPLCPDVLCRIDVDFHAGKTGSGERRERARFTITEDGAKLICPDGKTFQGVLYNGGSLTVGPFVLQAHEPIEPPPFFVGRSPFTQAPTEPLQGIVAPESPLMLVIQYEKGSRPVEPRHEMVFGSDKRIDEQTGIRFDNAAVSKEHARLDEQKGGLFITDLGSTNGTFLNNVPLDPHAPKRLEDGMVIRLSRNPKVPAIEVRAAADLAKRPLGKLDEAALVGDSEVMRKLLAKAVQVARGRACLRLFGETGTGKGLLARFIAFHAKRKLARFDCTTLAPMLAEAELFGHDKGAFTDAKEEKPGLVDKAQGGLLFFDEVGELPLPLQPKILGLLEEHEYRRVGGTKVLKADFRPICATLRDLEEMVAAGTFRADLETRTKGIDLFIPPLRERMEDIAPIAVHYLETREGEPRTIGRAALAALHRSQWPGNVRQLTHVVDGAADLTAAGGEIAEGTVRELMEQGVGKPKPPENLHFVDNAPERVAEYEKALMIEGLRRAGGKWRQASRLLGYKSLATFQRRAIEWGLLPRPAAQGGEPGAQPSPEAEGEGEDE